MIWYNGPDMGLRIRPRDSASTTHTHKHADTVSGCGLFATQIMSKKYILLQVYLFMIR